jgi:hypothetical protein
MSIQVTQDTKMQRKRGGQVKHWAEQARVQSWYIEVKRRCNLNDSQLDNEFAWRDEFKGTGTFDTRPRTFERIRRNCRKPQGRDVRWRGMNELVVAVDANQEFRGTRALYDALIWDLLQDRAPKPNAIQMQIDHILTANRLVRVPADTISIAHNGVLCEFNLPSLFDRCLHVSLNRLDRFTKIALTWLLYVQLEPPHNAGIRALVEERIDKLLDHFFEDYLPDDHLEFYSDAIGVLLQTRLDLSSRGTGGYGYIETLGTLVVVPAESVRNVVGP